MADKLRDQQRFEQQQSRFLGLGTADTSRQQWQRNVHRDTLSSYVGHPPMLQQFAVATGEPRSRVRQNLIDKMVNPLSQVKPDSGSSGSNGPNTPNGASS